MDDLVLLRDLIKNLARGQSIDLATLFRYLNFDTLFECVIARATSPCAAEAVARTFAFLGVRSAASCADVAPSESKFTRWYSRRLLTNLHIDVKPASFDLFHREMGKVYSLAKTIATSGITSANEYDSDRATRPASVVHGQRIGKFPRKTRTSFDTTTKRALSQTMSDPKSPRVTLSLSSSWASSVTSRTTDTTVPTPTTQFWQDPAPVDSDDESMPSHRAVDDVEPSIFEAVSTRSSLNERKPNHVFDPALKQTIWELAQNFAETSGLLCNLRKSGVAKERIVVLTIEAIMKHSKTASGAKLVVKNVNGLLRYFLDARSSGDVTLTGEKSVVLIHDYLEHAADRGRTVPAAIRHSLTCWAAALQVDWPLDHTLITSAAAVESNSAPKHAPPMTLETVKLLEGVATNSEVPPFKRAFAAGILLMSYTSLRFSDVQRLKSFEVNDDAAHGTLLTCKTKKPHGLDWPWACPRQGVSGSHDWVQPLLDFRAAHAKTNGFEPSFTFPRINHKWELESAEPAPYSTTRRKLALICVSLGDANGESYTLHSPKNLFRQRPTK